ncbi:MAG: class I SAM-dependent methyltransferase [candidate division Zixibacteria bacterium]|nr:class I SAM-dependent methyltransferase [Candidatus Tariuqbacter arcticus]
MGKRIYLPPKHHVPILEDPINFYYIPIFSSFFIKRLELVLSFAEGESLGRVLDIGCGTGVLFPEFSRRSDLVAGIDTFIQDYSLKGLMKMEGIEALLAWGSVEEIPFRTETFDTVACISTLEHIKDNQGAMTEIKRVLKPGGRLLAGFPVRNTITDKLLGGSTEFHIASHTDILRAARAVFGLIKEKHFPGWVPLNISLYCAFEGRKL